MASYFPKGLLYKEWKQQRLWAFLLLIAIGLQPVFVLTLDLLHMFGARPDVYQMYKFLYEQELGGYLHVNGYGVSSLLDSLPVGLLLFGSFVLSHERSQGGLWYTLSSPVTRREVLRCKSLLGLGFSAATVTVYALFLFTIWTMAPAGIPGSAVVNWWLQELFVGGAMFLIGLLGSVLVGNMIAAPIAGAGIAGVPVFLGTFIELVTSTTRQVQPGSYAYRDWVSEIGAFSPFLYLRVVHPSMYACVALMIGWGILAYILAQSLFHRTNVERMSNFFVFPVLWKLFFWLVSLFCGLILTAITYDVQREVVVPHNNPPLLGYSIRYIVFTVLVWLVIQMVTRLYRKKFVEV